jgi:hypothetical protein
MEDVKKLKHAHNSGGGMVYGLGLIGALIYSLQHATSFSDGLIGVLQSLVWPAMIVYKAFDMLRI